MDRHQTLEHEVDAAMPGAYSPNTIVLVFTKGWNYPMGNPGFPQHWAKALGQYVAGVPTDTGAHDYEFAGHELIETATDPAFSGWFTNQDPAAVAPCGVWGSEVCDDDDGVAASLQQPLADGFGGPGQDFTVVGSIDDIDGNNPTNFACPSGSFTCTAIGNFNQCASGHPGVQTLISGKAFTDATTTPPVAVVQTGSQINVLARTPGGLVHLVSNDLGQSYSVHSPGPVGQVTETPAAYSTDGRTIDMYARGTDGALYHWTYDGSSWSPPSWLGGYFVGPPSAAYIQSWQGHLVWVTGSDQNVYAWINGTWNSATMPPNVLAMSPPQVSLRGPDELDIYFTGMDTTTGVGGQIFLDAGWTGNWQQLPGNGFGLVTTVNRPNNPEFVDVFVREPVAQGGSNLWQLEYNAGSLVNSTVLTALPAGVGTVGAMWGWTPVGGQANASIYLFFTLANQIHWTNSDPNGANWGAVGQATTPVTSPASAFWPIPDNDTGVVYARRKSDGHLIQYRWTGLTGAAQMTLLDLGVSIM